MDVRDLGVVGYKEALRFQNEVLHKRLEGQIPDTLIMLEHKPVVTLGRIAGESGIIDRFFFREKRIPVISSARGGGITYHGPGQLVLYPIVDLSEKRRDVRFYMDFLEKTVSRGLKRLDVPAGRSGKRRGIWVYGKKIGFIGIAVKRWVTYHGVAININNDIIPFSRMYPCGEIGIEVTSAKQCLGRSVDMAEVKKIFAEQFIEDITAEYGALQPVRENG